MQRLPFFVSGFVCVVAFLLGGTPVVAQTSFQGRVVEVKSGDTLMVQREKTRVTVHLHGVDLTAFSRPEREIVRRYVIRRILKTQVRVHVRSKGTATNVYGEVFLQEKTSLNVELVRDGLAAWASAYASNRGDLELLEARAKREGRGFWGDASGQGVKLPPFTARKQTRRAKVPSLAKPKVALLPVKPKTLDSVQVAYPYLAHQMRERLWQIVLPTFLILTLLFFLLSAFRFKFERQRLFPQAVVSGVSAFGVALMLPLPLLAFWHLLAPGVLTFFTAAIVPLMLAALAVAGQWWHRERWLRQTPLRAFGRVDSGLVRAQGWVQAPFGVVYSSQGGITGIYVDEVCSRYELVAGERKPVHTWRVQEKRLYTTDFHLEGTDSSRLVVDSERAEFYPSRVARFYNDLEVQDFPDNPYPGDTRAEVRYIPASGEVTVWGRLYESASPTPDGSERRLGSSATHGGLVVADGNLHQVYPYQSLIVFVLTLLVLGLTGAVVFAIAAPTMSTTTNVSVALFFAGIAVLLRWGGQGITVWQMQKKLFQAWEDVELLLRQRRELLPSLLVRIEKVMPELAEAIRTAQQESRQVVIRSDFLAVEQQISGSILRCLERGKLPGSDVGSMRFWERLQNLEQEIAFRRKAYNEAAANYNLLRRGIRFGYLARAFGAEKAPLFAPVRRS